MLNKKKGNRLSKILSFLHEHVIALIIILVVLASLGSTLFIVKNNSDSDSEVNITYKPVETLYFAMDKVETLNPLTSSDSDTYYISQLVYSGLFRLDETLNIEPEIVSKYSTNSNEGTVKISLKNNVKFSDGSKVTAEDVRFTVSQIARIGDSSPYYEYVSKISTVETTGTYTLIILFDNPSDAAVDNLVFPIVSDSDYSIDGNKSTGSGQYVFGSYDKTKSLKLKPNPNYYGTIATNKIQFKVIPNKSKTTGLMTTDFITAYVNTSMDADVDAEDKNLKLTELPSNKAEFLAFNFKNENLTDSKVRQAIAKAIDVETVIEDNYGTIAVPSDTIYFPGFLGIGKKEDSYPYDQKGAADLLKDAGYKDYNEDGLLEDTKKNTLTFTLIVNSSDDSRVGTALTITDALEQIGIKVITKKLSKSTFQKTVKNGDFDMYISGYQFDKQYNLKELFDFNNDLGYNNKAVISDVNKLENALSADQQKEVFTSLRRKLIDDLAYYTLCYKTCAFVTVNRFQGQQLPTYFDVYRGASTWKWEQVVTVEKE